MGLLTITLMAVLPAVTPALAADEFVDLRQDLRPVLHTCATATDSTYVLDMGAVFDIVDHRFYRKTLRHLRSQDDFVSKIQRYQKDHAEFWGLVLENLEAAKGICQSPVGRPRGERDGRWDWFLVKGLPAVSWVIDAAVESEGRLQPATCYLYTWDDGAVAALYSDTLGGYPVHIAAPIRKVPDTPMPIYPDIRAVTFPNPDGTYDLGITASVTCDQYNAPTLERDSLAFQFKLMTSDGVVRAEDCAVHVGLARLITAIASKPQDFYSMGFATFHGLAPDTYRCDVEIEGSRLNRGHDRVDVKVPSPQATPRVSDIAFLAGDLPTGNIAPGIQRNNHLLYSEAMTRFRIDSILDPYMEIWPAQRGCAHVRAYLLPVSGRTHSNAPRVQVGKIGGVQAVAGEEYVFPLKEITPLIPANQNPRAWQDYRVFDSTYVIDEVPWLFVDRLPLRGVRRGSYVLRVTVSGCGDSAHVGTAWTTIEIR